MIQGRFRVVVMTIEAIGSHGSPMGLLGAVGGCWGLLSLIGKTWLLLSRL